MAITRTDKSSTISVEVEVGTDTYKKRTLNYVNPNLSDADSYEIGTQFGDLQSHTVERILKTDKYTLVSDT